jgi:hypothetical protein
MLDCSRIVVKKFLPTFHFISFGENTKLTEQIEICYQPKVKKETSAMLFIRGECATKADDSQAKENRRGDLFV